jgi:hypothetical protein
MKMKHAGKSLLAVLGTLLLAVPLFADYSAVNAFPSVTNSGNVVNGVWSYGYITTVNTAGFILDTTNTNNYFGTTPANAVGFYTLTTSLQYGSYQLPTDLKNVTSGNVNYSTINNWSPEELLLHPGTADQLAVVQFTAPTAGSYVLNGFFAALDSDPTSDYVLTGSTILYSITSTLAPQAFSLTETLAAGQTVDFAVGFGPSGSLDNDSTGFNVTITPEPGFYGLMAIGLIGITFALRRRRAA